MKVDLQKFGNDSYYFVIMLDSNSRDLIYKNRDFAESFGIKESEFNDRLLLKVISHNNVIASSASALNFVVFALCGKSKEYYVEKFSKHFENELILLKLSDN